MTKKSAVSLLGCLAAAAGSLAQAPTPGAPSGLAGTSWHLVRFQGGDDTVLVPDDRTKYSIAFGEDGSLTARIDCNRGRSTWASPGPPQLQLGPLALTRAMCPPGSLHDRIVKDWSYVRSYLIKDGRLFLSLMADGGIYELEPIAGAKSAVTKSPVVSTGPVRFGCTATDATSGPLTATFYQTAPPLVLVERAGRTRPAFGVPAASGAKYEGADLLFWEARGEASVTWSGVELTCTRQ